VFGVVYLLLTLVGFIQPDLPLGIHLDLGCNLVHLVLAVWGIYAGYFAGETRAAPAA